MRTWPSRRLQIITALVLLVGAALRIFWPPLSREGRAERLYESSWFVRNSTDHFPDHMEPNNLAIECLNKALELSPGNPRYEQALVCQYGDKRLPELLRTRHLGTRARCIAIMRAMSALPYREYSESPEKSGLTRKLRRLELAESLVESDADNSLAHYVKADCLLELGRVDDALAEMRVGNGLGPIRQYIPDVPGNVAASCAVVNAVRSDVNADSRNLADMLRGVANSRLRNGDVRGTCYILKQTSQLGINVASGKPGAFVSLLAGRRIHSAASRNLRAIYKDFGMRDELASLRRVDRAYERIRASYHSESLRWDRAIAMPYILPVMLIHSFGVVIGFSALPVLPWVLALIIRRRRAQEAVVVAPWSEGFLTRMFTLLYVPVFAGSLAVIYQWPGLLFLWGDWPRIDAVGPYAVAAVVLLNLLLGILVLRALHHLYDEYTGERTSIFRFIFKVPANAKAWTRKYLVVAFSAQLPFLLCCALLATIVYRPIFGGHPWEVGRFRVVDIAHEQAVVKHLADDILKSSLAAHGSRHK